MDSKLLNLASSNSYITPLKYVSGRIVEYDIKSANITMLRKYNIIDENYYNFLASLPKQNREVEIGLLIKSDHKIYETIKNGIIKAKKELFSTNNIDINSIVRIANDAVYINSSNDLKFTKFDIVEFKQKSINNSFLKLDKLLIFFSCINDDLDIDIKGINKSLQLLHENYMITFLANIIYLIERVSIIDAIQALNDFYIKYINLKLDKGYYRELNENSLYKIKYSNFYISSIDNIEDIDINYNLYLLRELYSILIQYSNIKRVR